MERRPFEVVAECRMAGFPAVGDVERMNAQIEKARGARPDVVRAAVVPPAVYRDRQYVLQARFLVWASDGAGATSAVEGLLKDAAVPCSGVVPSGRALGAHEVTAAPVAPRRRAVARATVSRRVAPPVKKSARKRGARPARATRRRAARRRKA